MSGYQVPSFDVSLGIKSVRLSVEQVKGMPDAELLAVLAGESEHEGLVPSPLQQVITLNP